MENEQTTKTETVKSELEICQSRAEEYLNNWKRSRADFINYKKEEGGRLEDVARFSKETLALGLIDAVDDLELAINQAPDKAREEKEWFAGLTATLEIFQKFLQKNGVEKIKTVGGQFNPLLHEAVDAEPDPPASESYGEAKREEVIKEYRAGYVMNGKVIRPARVKISN
ncbi:MAG: nucleotide exchange factor GrpE [Candidatus Yanofskybacteria bacterium RIFCSPHIGHO2_01_FULL_45_42]|uniref:Protein GrpE n=3 Tax=Candidatus Yanofskyibacteriota TaxID=1752733 RepID=A0A1F8EZT8_9BACT|nr:MAG: nucleotide exchange factor GrpE [Candidatus Yanofskybacteria bacterium RIFCSPHIGHO2_01_FULL_45_42]OGN16045.1 MAG: nucleotide exchange factor GrpE [Candidatus Yanofskybacteria bacterium RIFCSPHIGHO2_02_FULL_46_19]OGN26170.1 MAG: nucleotide exchange factor GrpE [Candidatus Yanofskybacteria bacterium RIFCSPLOWO2_01_FULL_45_72]OGN32141.1 MAG: nucleotide exchange factor GrpE [Candidatus Yanofskybacteria bacterium RIFCSPLOWO2_02_FULL_45_18]